MFDIGINLSLMKHQILTNGSNDETNSNTRANDMKIALLDEKS